MEPKILRINHYFSKRFAKHFNLESFIIPPYEIKKIVENCLALKYEGSIEDYDRENFKDLYNKLFKDY